MAGATGATGTEVRLPAWDIALTLPLTTPPAPGAPVVVGLRPEHMLEKAPVMLQLAVEVIENLGGQTYVYGRSPDGDQMVAEARFLPPGWRGERLDIGFDPASLLLFDAASTRRIR